MLVCCESPCGCDVYLVYLSCRKYPTNIAAVHKRINRPTTQGRWASASRAAWLCMPVPVRAIRRLVLDRYEHAPAPAHDRGVDMGVVSSSLRDSVAQALQRMGVRLFVVGVPCHAMGPSSLANVACQPRLPTCHRTHALLSLLSWGLLSLAYSDGHVRSWMMRTSVSKSSAVAHDLLWTSPNW